MSEPPPLIESQALRERLDDPALLLVDLRSPEAYAQGHVPGARNLGYGALIRSEPPVGGLLPDLGELSRALSAIGLTPGHTVVAYDDEGGGRAGRLLWTLDALGHERGRLLNGGIHAWMGDELPLTRKPVPVAPSDYRATLHNPDVIADRTHILERLGTADFVALDTRTPAEYRGEDVRAARGGHIPGAVNLNWLEAIDRYRALRFKPDEELRTLLENRRVTPDKEVVVYCQTHHRSSHTYMVLKHLNYPRVRGYPGAWSDWGNAPNTPVET
ncbi:MAG: sulfurtransferase [Candidatus Competibacterales bacterium]|nr:sulfurtransferase [Candidatus Competibacterales bacterium]